MRFSFFAPFAHEDDAAGEKPHEKIDMGKAQGETARRWRTEDRERGAVRSAPTTGWLLRAGRR